MNKTIQNTLQLTDDYIDYAKRVMCDCVAHEVYNAVARGDDHVVIDLGIITITIYFGDGQVQFEVAELNKNVQNAINEVLFGGDDPMTKELEEKLDAAVSNLYKELL